VATISLLLYATSIASIRLVRKHLPLLRPFLQVTETQYLDQRFPREITGIHKGGEDARRQELEAASLLRWAGTYQDIPKTDRVYYIESEPIPENCDDARVFCIVAQAMTIRGVAAYLVSPAEGKPLWLQPVMSKQYHSISGNKITVLLERPDKAQRLVLFVEATSCPPSMMPDDCSDAVEPANLLKDAYFEFE
uniref:hypothetical protein n=1 Tax=Stieleria mannarensis TaxID=2755585 RepID=UPI001C721A9A